MAGRMNAQFLKPEERVKLLKEIQSTRQVRNTETARPSGSTPASQRRNVLSDPSTNSLRKKATQNTGSTPPARKKRVTLSTQIQIVATPSFGSGTGCLVCHKDDDHANMLLCENCNGEYHRYCLVPPLEGIPTGDWFCGSCRPDLDDGLDRRVAALPPEFTSRFGEVCWAQGGVGYGWWPSCIFDPRLTLGSARSEARKNLGKKHLVYFFKCDESPFSILPDHKLLNWYEGLADDLHLGKAARTNGKDRHEQFRLALQAALLELDRPVRQRLDLQYGNTSSPPKPWTTRTVVLPATAERKRAREEAKVGGGPQWIPVQNAQRHLDLGVFQSKRVDDQGGSLVSKQCPMGNQEDEDGDLFCKVIKKTETADGEAAEEVVGFVILSSRQTATLAHVRESIQCELVADGVPLRQNWRFYVPTLGPVSSVQEAKLGSALAFLRKALGDKSGRGTSQSPLLVHVVDMEASSKRAS